MRNTLFEAVWQLMNPEMRTKLIDEAHAYFRSIGSTRSEFYIDKQLIETIPCSHTKHVEKGSIVVLGQKRYPVLSVQVEEEVVMKEDTTFINKIEIYKLGQGL